MESEFGSLNPGSCRTYLVAGAGSREALLVDPAIDHVDDYLKLLDRKALKLTHVIDTHTHADHISGAASLVDRTGCAYVMHAKAPARCVTQRVADGDSIEAAGTKLAVMHTPGHTKDGICLVVEGRVLTGDTLFLDDGGAGRDDLPGGDPGEHYDSLQRILGLPDALIVHPGHDYRGRSPTELGRQRQTNPHLRRRSKEGFVRYLNELCLGPAEWMKEVLKANYACSRDPRAVAIPTEGNACEVMRAPAAGPETASFGPAELVRLMESGASPVLLDVREPFELTGELGCLDGITHIPLGSLGSRLGELDRDRHIVVICKSGVRASMAAKAMAQSGFSKVDVLAGGMLRWRREVAL